MNDPKAKILILDIETAPAEVYTWGLKDQNIGIEQVKHDQYMLMWAAKWVGDKKVYSDKLVNHPHHFKRNKRCDRLITKSILGLMNQAHIIITQNGDNFDLKWINQLCLKHDLQKPNKFYSVDLLKESRKDYYSLSHKLDFRGRQLAIGSKKPHNGFRLWLQCMAGNITAFEYMEEYCKQDVKLTEEYYLKLRPRMRNHPNVNMFYETLSKLKCVACGSNRIVRRGYNYGIGGRRQRHACKDCGYRMTLGGRCDTTTRVPFRGEG